LENSIVLFGGTFNPIHNGHVALCKVVYRMISPQKIILVPTNPFYKEGEELAPGKDRINMCRLAVRQLPYVFVDDYEIQKPPPCYTVELLREMRQRYPKKKVYLLLGDDAFCTFPHWYQWRECGALAELLVATRHCREKEIQEIQENLAVQGIHSTQIGNPIVQVSSSGVRREISSGVSGSEIDQEVFQYIQKKGFYRIQEQILL